MDTQEQDGQDQHYAQNDSMNSDGKHSSEVVIQNVVETHEEDRSAYKDNETREAQITPARHGESSDAVHSVSSNGAIDGSGNNEHGISVSVSVGQAGDNVSVDQGGEDEAATEAAADGGAGQGSPAPGAVVLNVKCSNGDDVKVVTVEVMSCVGKKPFIGGFRHKLSGVEFHHAATQTNPRKYISNGIEKFERDTQTVASKSQVQQTYCDSSTQMTKPGCFVSNVTDKILVAGKYVTAAEKEAHLLKNVIILQCHWRRWLARRYVQRLRNDRNLRIEWERVQAEQKEQDRAMRIRKEFERRMHPKSKEDFDLLYAALEKWRREEMDRIDQTRSGAERKAALIGLLEQEEYLIQSIERHRFNANEVNSKKFVRDFLNKAASSKKWRSDDGKMLEMDTPHTIRAQQLRDLYASLEMRHLTQDERLDVLLTLKHTVKEHDCKLTQELTELIDREADLLTRGMKVSNLEGLRKRILVLFLQYCKTPEFNPEVARLLKVPQNPASLRKDIYFCPSCNSYLPASDFPIASNSRIVGRCKKCAKLDNDARLRNDFTKIRALMTALKTAEEGYDDGSKIAFTIQYADLRYLVENIWNSQSALSGLDELAELTLVRWNIHEHWSPWNCVLLSKEEASAHIRLDNVVEAYGRIFVGKVHHRHVLAKKYFAKLLKVSENMDTQQDKKKKMRSVKPVAEVLDTGPTISAAV